MVLNDPYVLVAASAGSGKTYQLAKKYLMGLLSMPKPNTRPLLAITFTNKAVKEMRSRILEYLYAFGETPVDKKYRPMFLEIAEELDIDPEDLTVKANKTLFDILHNYNFFEVVTIDKFTHKLIRTFARDFNLDQGFSVELDTDALLDKAIYRMLSSIGDDERLTQSLIDLSLDKIEDNKSWNFIKDLKDIGKLYFNEVHYRNLSRINHLDWNHFDAVQKFLHQNVADQKAIIIRSAQKCLDLIQAKGLGDTDFNRKSLPLFLRKLLVDQDKIDYSSKWTENLLTAQLYTKSSSAHVQNQIEDIRPDLSDYFEQIRDSYIKLKFYQNLKSNVRFLAVLNELSKKIMEVQEIDNLLHISEFNKIISKEIGNQPVPYIYERLGERYGQFFIDEFQDTSTLQWNNLVPLVANAIEGQEGNLPGLAYLVGDAKQSIYRWRGGDPNQFLGILGRQSNYFSIEPKIEGLNSNWRSQETIVEFNNGFFKHSANVLNNEGFKELYTDYVHQFPKAGSGGYVEIQLVKKEESDFDALLTRTYDSIKTVISKGYHFKDICVLVRKNKEAVEIANFLLDKKIPIVSSEALLLANSPKVGFLIDLISFLARPNEMEYQFNILYYLTPSETNFNDLALKYLGKIDRFFIEFFEFDLKAYQNKDLLGILETTIAKVDLVPISDAHVTHFLDEVYSFCLKEASDPNLFLEYWNEKNQGLTVPLPEGKNAVRVMTVHKAKGLEFPFVIFPIAKGKINDSKSGSRNVWVEVDAEKFAGFPIMYANKNQYLEKFSPETLQAVKRDEELGQLDDLNVLYVALTRASKGLFVIALHENPDSYFNLLENYVDHLQLSDKQSGEFSIGQLLDANVHVKPAPEIPLEFRYGRLNFQEDRLEFTEAISESQDRAMEYGALVHRILSNLKDVSDLENLDKFPEYAGLESEKKATISNMILGAVNHPQLKEFYKIGVKAYNEVEILDPNGNSHIPDRLVLQGNKAIIIDYKTGNKKQVYLEQLDRYAFCLSRMGYLVEHKILVYLNQGIELQFV